MWKTQEVCLEGPALRPLPRVTTVPVTRRKVNPQRQYSEKGVPPHLSPPFNHVETSDKARGQGLFTGVKAMTIRTGGDTVVVEETETT